MAPERAGMVDRRSVLTNIHKLCFFTATILFCALSKGTPLRCLSRALSLPFQWELTKNFIIPAKAAFLYAVVHWKTTDHKIVARE